MARKNIIKKEIEKQQLVPKKRIIKRTYFFEIYLAVSIMAFGLLAMLAKHNSYFGFDLRITRSIQDISIPGFEFLMRFITLLGNMEWGIITIVLFAVIFILLRKKTNALFLIASVIGIESLAVLFKGLISRPRPDPDLINQIGTYIYSDSFPSGHVMYYIGCYGFLLFLAFSKLKRGIFRSSILIILSAMLVLIGISRIYVGAHWFSDTLGAYLIGNVWLFIIIHVYKKYTQKVK